MSEEIKSWLISASAVPVQAHSIDPRYVELARQCVALESSSALKVSMDGLTSVKAYFRARLLYAIEREARGQSRKFKILIVDGFAYITRKEAELR